MRCSKAKKSVETWSKTAAALKTMVDAGIASDDPIIMAKIHTEAEASYKEAAETLQAAALAFASLLKK